MAAKKWPKKIPLVPNFGRFYINVQSLADCLLSIQRKHYAYAFPKEMISSYLRDVILKLITDKILDEETFCKLDEREINMLKILIKRSHIDDTLLYKIADMFRDKRELKDRLISRLNITKGEIIAGNNNPSLTSDLASILNELRDNKWIEKKFYDQIMEDFT